MNHTLYFKENTQSESFSFPQARLATGESLDSLTKCIGYDEKSQGPGRSPFPWGHSADPTDCGLGGSHSPHYPDPRSETRITLLNIVRCFEAIKSSSIFRIRIWPRPNNASPLLTVRFIYINGCKRELFPSLNKIQRWIQPVTQEAVPRHERDRADPAVISS